ncbi:hypothetical protein THAOC_27427 [Thalassiosira oceanica]|uniref:C3H1-type domain-containing protein n=1 Tax=Thalassiosira oceanica TaxID=159749 RepID=K0RWM0_THAOC|nr:hypothetical protein THAOC_27427 [Thalassiosira oceanica]|eukprot:EJK53191.1 hypothetical protein THAOC_27427 [Thalassiosira oceanica]
MCRGPLAPPGDAPQPSSPSQKRRTSKQSGEQSEEHCDAEKETEMTEIVHSQLTYFTLLVAFHRAGSTKTVCGEVVEVVRFLQESFCKCFSTTTLSRATVELVERGKRRKRKGARQPERSAASAFGYVQRGGLESTVGHAIGKSIASRLTRRKIFTLAPTSTGGMIAAPAEIINWGKHWINHGTTVNLHWLGSDAEPAVARVIFELTLTVPQLSPQLHHTTTESLPKIVFGSCDNSRADENAVTASQNEPTPRTVRSELAPSQAFGPPAVDFLLELARSQELNLPTTAPPGLGPLLSAQAPPFRPSPRRAPQEVLPSVDDFDGKRCGVAPAVASYATVATTTAPTHLASMSHGVLDTRAQATQGRVEAAITSSSGGKMTPPSSPAPRRPDPGTAPSPTSVAEVAEAIQPTCFPAKPKEGKFKTELCRNFEKPGGCPYGSSCTYAHGAQELRTKPLLTQHLEGKLDLNSYRRHPCFDQVSGGACSIGPDCPCLHDPRTSGQFKTPLRQTDYQRPKNAPEEVSKMHQALQAALQGASPVYGFVPSFVWNVGDDESSSQAAFFDFYGYCCNMADGLTDKAALWPVSPRSPVNITEVHRLSIALEMRMARKAQSFVFKPTHLFFGEPALLLQTRYFLIDGPEVFSVSDDLGELYGGSNAAVICAREIAFGPVGDATVRPASIWFNIDDEGMIECSTKELKKNAYQLWNDRRSRKFSGRGASTLVEGSIPPFVSHQPADDAAFDLVTGIQAHSRDALRDMVSSVSPSIAYDELQSLDRRGQGLYESFIGQRRHWMTWQWPLKQRSGKIDETTPVPSIDGAYTVSSVDPSANRHGKVMPERASLTTGHLWESFVSTMGSGDHRPCSPRLDTLKDLSLGAAEPPLGHKPHLRQQQSIGVDGANCPVPLPNMSPLQQMLGKWEMLMEKHI